MENRKSDFIAEPLDEHTWPDFARLGGGTLEGYPEDTAGRSVSGSFLDNGTLALFEQHGFQRTRQLGKNRWVVTKVVEIQA